MKSTRLSTFEDYVQIGVPMIAFIAITFWLLFHCFFSIRSDFEEDNDSASESAGVSSPQMSEQPMNAFPAPASAQLIQLTQLDSFKYKRSPESDVMCSICLSLLADDEEVRMLPKCNHYFHKGCIDVWLSLKPPCPLCLTPIDFVAQQQPEQKCRNNCHSSTLVRGSS